MQTAKFFLLAPLLAGCQSWERVADSNNAARVSVASYNAQAVIQAEQARTQAAIGVAQASAMADVSVNAMWAAQVPWVVMAICVTVVIVAYCWYRSRVAAQPQAQPTIQVFPPDQRQAMQAFARAHGGQIVWTPEGKPFLEVDGRRRQLRITAKD